MNSNQNRSWMYARLDPYTRYLTREFVDGVGEFVAFVRGQNDYNINDGIRCPCVQCKCCKFFVEDDVKFHLYRRGFMLDYEIWVYHGESLAPNLLVNSLHNRGSATSSPRVELSSYEPNLAYDMVIDAAGPSFNPHMSNEDFEEAPNEETQKWYDLLNKAEEPLWSIGDSHRSACSQLSAATRLMNIKANSSMSQRTFDEITEAIGDMLPPNNKLISSYYEGRKMLRKFSQNYVKIDVCKNNCMLYYKDSIKEEHCRICSARRYKESNTGAKVPTKYMHYLPLTPRLKRIYATKWSAKHMRWHWEKGNAKEDLVSHPSDGEDWKNFDKLHPLFAEEPRNVRLALCSDGFSPFGNMGNPYSCWPVIVTPLNLPPSISMTRPYMFLSTIIPGRKNPKIKIDVFLQPLIDELLDLWNVGVEVYDSWSKSNFVVKAMLMWTINDFPAFGMLSGWTTAGRLACPICMQDTKAFTLKHGRKQCHFDCHRQFLPMDHRFRKNKTSFKKNKMEQGEPPSRLTGSEMYGQCRLMKKVTEEDFVTPVGYGVQHNFNKRSIFWDLPYWKDNLIRHNLDVMHIEKNVFDNFFFTVMNIKGRQNKDNDNARKDIALVCKRPSLHLIQKNGKEFMPKAPYTCSVEQRKEIFDWIKALKFPDGYVSNIRRCVDDSNSKMIGMKSHDCHVFMERLMPIAFRCLPDAVWSALTELSHFFRDLCATELNVEHLKQMEKDVPVLLCKLEQIFPPSVFDVMEHLIVHLPYEARVGGPVQYRWMYVFERYI